MSGFEIHGLTDDFTREVRETGKSPGYGHPVVRELARGTGPCRACLEQFRIGEEERLLFTYRPASTNGTLGAPGPVFIHADACLQYRGTDFPPGLRSLPLLIEARASENRVIVSCAATGAAIDGALAELLANPDVDYLYIRHGEAGCHIARVDRAKAQ